MRTIKILAVVLVSALLLSVCAMFASADPITFKPETKNGKIYGIPANTTVSQLKNAYYNAIISVYDLDGRKIGDESVIGTGYIVKINSIQHTAVVMGDLDGDGQIKTYDYIMVKRAYIGNGITLTNLQLEAADVDIDNGKKLSPINYIKIKRAYMGTYNINQKYTCDPYDPEADESGWTSGWV